MALSYSGSEWRDLLAASAIRAGDLAELPGVDISETERVIRTYPMRINPYYLSLIKEKNDPLWLQALPSSDEIAESEMSADPLNEEAQSPLPSIIHRYPDRVIFLVSGRCAMYCRYCMRKRKVGMAETNFASSAQIEKGLDYIRGKKTISDVILSGGDPLLLENDRLEAILESLFGIPHVEVVRIHTRVPSTLPQRITENLVELLKRFRPLYINTHFNHPDELTEIAEAACSRLADAGIPLGCQSVLLRGVNDSVGTMRCLMKKLLKNRIRPYYLHHPDQVRGTAHFRPPVSKGLEIMKGLRGHLSGLCVPHYMIDLPGGGGKVPLLPEYLCGPVGEKIEIVNFEGKSYTYF